MYSKSFSKICKFCDDALPGDDIAYYTGKKPVCLNCNDKLLGVNACEKEKI